MNGHKNTNFQNLLIIETDIYHISIIYFQFKKKKHTNKLLNAFKVELENSLISSGIKPNFLDFYLKLFFFTVNYLYKLN